MSMPKISDILNYSDELNDEASTAVSTAPSSLSLNSSSTSTSFSTPISSSSSSNGKDLYTKHPTIKEEPAEGLSEVVKNSIEKDLEKRNEEAKKSSLGTNSRLSSRQKLAIHPYTFPKALVNKKLLSKKLVQIAIRRKSLSGKDTSGHGSKLHTKSLEATLRVKLTLAPDLISLYNSLTPHTNRRKSLRVFKLNDSDSTTESTGDTIVNSNYLNDVVLSTKAVQLIDNNLVRLSVFSNKVMKSFNQHGNNSDQAEHKFPTFNSLNTAVHNLFGIDDYSLVRVTRSTATDHDGSILLKFETAKPGELNLIDDEDFTDDMLHSLGQVGNEPSNIFIKKVIARPRYKSDMKIYLIPKDVHKCLYVDDRMFERDLINGVIEMDLPFYKSIYCAFNYEEVYNSVKQLAKAIPPATEPPAKFPTEKHTINPRTENNNSYFSPSPALNMPNGIVHYPHYGNQSPNLTKPNPNVRHNLISLPVHASYGSPPVAMRGIGLPSLPSLSSLQARRQTTPSAGYQTAPPSHQSKPHSDST